jgi:hypothetical protein
LRVNDGEVEIGRQDDRMFRLAPSVKVLEQAVIANPPTPSAFVVSDNDSMDIEQDARSKHRPFANEAVDMVERLFPVDRIEMIPKRLSADRNALFKDDIRFPEV